MAHIAEQQRLIGEIGEWLGPNSLNFFGLQFAGKDNRANELALPLNAAVLSGGDILRNSHIPDDIRAIMNSGALIPSDDYAQIVLPYLSDPDFDGRPIFLSAVGRMAGEEVGVMKATESAGHPLAAVPYLKITTDESFRRMALADRGRDDDTLEGLRKRHEEFEAKTQPVLDAYE